MPPKLSTPRRVSVPLPPEDTPKRRPRTMFQNKSQRAKDEKALTRQLRNCLTDEATARSEAAAVEQIELDALQLQYVSEGHRGLSVLANYLGKIIFDTKQTSARAISNVERSLREILDGIAVFNDDLVAANISSSPISSLVRQNAQHATIERELLNLSGEIKNGVGRYEAIAAEKSRLCAIAEHNFAEQSVNLLAAERALKSMMARRVSDRGSDIDRLEAMQHDINTRWAALTKELTGSIDHAVEQCSMSEYDAIYRRSKVSEALDNAVLEKCNMLRELKGMIAESGAEATDHTPVVPHSAFAADVDGALQFLSREELLQILRGLSHDSRTNTLVTSAVSHMTKVSGPRRPMPPSPPANHVSVDESKPKQTRADPSDPRPRTGSLLSKIL